MKTIELTVNAHFSESNDCICCKANHRYATSFKTADGQNYDAGELAKDFAKELPHGSVIKITVEKKD